MQKFSEYTSVIVEAIQDKKGSGITLIDLSDIPASSAPEFVICQGKSTSQVAAIADNIREQMQQRLNVKPYRYDGYRNAQWIILDYGSVMIHVFLPDSRSYYNLEELWGDGNFTRIPDLD